jgi:hypothetical protein
VPKQQRGKKQEKTGGLNETITAYNKCDISYPSMGMQPKIGDGA